jgi:uncharacterized protein
MSDTGTALARDISRDQLLVELRSLLRPAFEREGMAHMVLFGSRARGDNRQDSDVDLLIDVMPGRRFSLLDLIGVKHIVEDQIGLPTDVSMQRSISLGLRQRTERDRVDVF